MTGLTQQWCATLEQSGMYGTMRRVAQGAVFTHRRMIEQYGTTELGMATDTKLICCVARQLTGSNGCMRVVAIRTDHCSRANALVGSDWMSGQLHAVGALPIMTLKAHCSLRRLLFYRIGRSVHGMATDTSGVIALVHAACPGKADVIIVAIHAYRVLVRHRRRRIGTEGCDGAVLAGRSAPPGMRAAGTVAVLTLQLCHR